VGGRAALCGERRHPNAERALYFARLWNALSNAHWNSNGYSDRYADSHTDGNSNGYTYCNSNSNPHSNSDTLTQCHTECDTYSVAATATDTPASSHAFTPALIRKELAANGMKGPPHQRSARSQSEASHLTGAAPHRDRYSHTYSNAASASDAATTAESKNSSQSIAN